MTEPDFPMTPPIREAWQRIRKETWPPGRFWWGGKTRGNDAPMRRRCSGFSDDAPDLRSVVEDTEVSTSSSELIWYVFKAGIT